jgi:hypothetical protein
MRAFHPATLDRTHEPAKKRSVLIDSTTASFDIGAVNPLLLPLIPNLGPFHLRPWYRATTIMAAWLTFKSWDLFPQFQDLP